MARTLTHDGRTLTIGQWSRETGIPQSTIRSRLDKLKMTPAEALTRPVDPRFDPTPAPPPESRPAPRLVKDERGRGVARWTEGVRRLKRVFGRWGERATVSAYNKWAAEWHANQGRPADPGGAVSVAALVVRCLEWAKRHFVKRGKPTSEVHGFRAALGAVVDLYGDEPAADFTATKLRAIQTKWAREKKAMKTCNGYLGYVVRCFSWGVSRDLVPAAVADSLAHVPRLLPGRGGADEPEPVAAVADAVYAITLPLLDPAPDRQRVYAGILELQRHTGMRPGEVLELRPEDIDRSRTPWLYTPPSGGKTLHLEKVRRAWIGPKGRAVLAPFLTTAEVGQPVFRLRRRRGKGLLPVRIERLRAAVARGCELAGVSVWTPNQLRHAKATEVQRRYEDDATVAAALGNTPEVARQVYVDGPGDAVAKRVAEELG